MATRTIWQDLYGMQMDMGTDLSSTNGVAPTYTAGSNVGIQGTASANGKFSLALTDHPNFKAPSGTLDTEQATGKSTRQNSEYNVVQTGEAVQFNLPLLGDAYNVSAFQALLFQSGCTTDATIAEASGWKRSAGLPYTSAECDNFCSFSRILGGATASGHDLDVRGGICHTLTLSGEAGGVLNIEPTIYAAKWSQANLSSHATTLSNSFPNVVPLKFQDSTFAVLDNFGIRTDGAGARFYSPVT